MSNSVLLESGTNELELLEFRLGNNFYGINVAKVKENILSVPATTSKIISAFIVRTKLYVLYEDRLIIYALTEN